MKTSKMAISILNSDNPVFDATFHFNLRCLLIMVKADIILEKEGNISPNIANNFNSIKSTKFHIEILFSLLYRHISCIMIISF